MKTIKQRLRRSKRKIKKPKYEYNESETERVVRIQLKELVLYSIYLGVFGIWIYGVMDPPMFYYTYLFRNHILEGKYDDAFFGDIPFKKVNNYKNLWTYLEHLITNGFQWRYWYDSIRPVKNTSAEDKNIMFENRLLGRPRIRQVRVRNDSCKVHHEFGAYFSRCFGRYSKSTEDKSPYGLNNGTAWVYNEAIEDSHDYWGTVSTYGAGGYWFEVPLDPVRAQKQLDILRDNIWIDLHTRAVFVDFTVYNVNLNLFCVAKLVIEFPATGGILRSHNFVTAKFLENNTKTDCFLIGCSWLIIAFILYYFIEEVMDCKVDKWKYFTSSWNYIDIFIIYTTASYFLYYAYRRFKIVKYIKQAAEQQDVYINFEQFAHWQRIMYIFISVGYFFSWIKLFKYLNFNKTMSQLRDTLKKCAKDILGFALMFFIVFFAFSQLGYLLFGGMVADYGTLRSSIFTSIRTVLGQFDYEHLEKANRVLGPFYILILMFFIFLILLNMFLAIINDAYSDIKSEIRSVKELTILSYLKRGLHNLTKICCKDSKCCQKRETICIRTDDNDKLFEDMTPYEKTMTQMCILLENANFTADEIRGFIAKFDITEERLEESTLEEVLGFMEEDSNVRTNTCQHRMTVEDEFCLDKTPAGDDDDMYLAQLDLERYELYLNSLNQKIDELEKSVNLFEKRSQLLKNKNRRSNS